MKVNHRRRVVTLGDIKTGALMPSWDKSKGYLFTALVVSGMKMARVWLGLCKGTGELLDMIRVYVDGSRNLPGDRQVANPQAAEYRVRVRRAERLVVAMKGL